MAAAALPLFIRSYRITRVSFFFFALSPSSRRLRTEDKEGGGEDAGLGEFSSLLQTGPRVAPFEEEERVEHVRVHLADPVSAQSSAPSARLIRLTPPRRRLGRMVRRRIGDVEIGPR
jgi:hypothetical protein